MFTVLALAGVSLPALPALPAQAAPTDDSISVETTPTSDAATKTVIITFDKAQKNPSAAANAAVSTAAAVVAGAEVTAVKPITATTVAVTLNTALSSTQADKLQASVEHVDGVKAADPSITFYPTADTNYEPYLWSITTESTSKWGVQANLAWPTSTGESVIVGVLDTGITAHPDLTGSSSSITGGNVIAGYDFVSSAASARDGNGRDSNPTDVGDYTTKNGNIVEYSSWHGTHVSGIIAALKNDSGVVGVAPEAKIEPVRVLGTSGTEADLIAAIRWASGYAVSGVGTNPNPVDVINMSLGGSGKCGTALQAAVSGAVSKGIPVVVAAGNGNSKGVGQPLANTAPANCKNVIAVTATTSKGKKTSYSNYGTASKPATIAAPGGKGTSEPCGNGNALQCGAVWSTLNAGETTATTSSYGFEAGTSMAAPHVAGVLALVKSLHPTWNVAQLTAVIRGTVTRLSSCSVTKCGAGLVNAAKAVKITGFFTKVTGPTVTGRFKVGKKLTATAGSWSPTPTSVSYQWLRNGTSISKATAATYKLTKKDKGKKVSVRITVRGGNLLGQSAVSASSKVKK
jgi:serine protease